MWARAFKQLMQDRANQQLIKDVLENGQILQELWDLVYAAYSPDDYARPLAALRPNFPHRWRLAIRV